MSELPRSADIVVGAGIIGLTSAWELSRRGYDVCVIERNAPDTHNCSWAGGGMLSPLPPTVPVPELEPLLSQSLAMYPHFCDELNEASGIDPEYWVCGARWIGDKDQQNFPRMAQVRNPRMLKALRVALEKRRVPIVWQTEVQGWSAQADVLEGVRTSHGAVACRYAVLAAGAWSGQCSAFPIRPAKGQMLLFKAEAGRLDQILIGDHAYLIPRRDGHILLGSTIEDVGFDVTPTADARDRLHEHGLALWPQLSGLPLAGQWAGLRPRADSVAPIIQKDLQITGLLLNTGHFRLGITLAPASALRLANLL